jgi:hypothetical protein
MALWDRFKQAVGLSEKVKIHDPSKFYYGPATPVSKSSESERQSTESERQSSPYKESYVKSIEKHHNERQSQELNNKLTTAAIALTGEMNDPSKIALDWGKMRDFLTFHSIASGYMQGSTVGDLTAEDYAKISKKSDFLASRHNKHAITDTKTIEKFLKADNEIFNKNRDIRNSLQIIGFNDVEVALYKNYIQKTGQAGQDLQFPDEIGKAKPLPQTSVKLRQSEINIKEDQTRKAIFTERYGTTDEELKHVRDLGRKINSQGRATPELTAQQKLAQQARQSATR